MITIRTEILNETDNSIKQSIKKYTDPIDAMIGLARELGFKIDFAPLSKAEQKDTKREHYLPFC